MKARSEKAFVPIADRCFRLLSIAAAFLLCAANQAPAQQGALNGEWRSFGGDPGNTKYSPLDQINRDNFQDLEVAFRWASISTKVTKDNPRIRAGQFKAVPLMVDGVLYVSTAISQVAAIDAGTGETIWEYDPKSYERLGRPANLGWQHKGVAYWGDGDDGRIIHTTHDLKLIALNAKTGALYPDFGDNGIVDLSTSLGKPVTGRIITNAAPAAICGNTIVTGHVVADGVVVKEGAPGHIRGFDVKTGEMKWIFHTIPQEGEFGNETWENGSWKYTGATNVWTMMAVDNELGYVYLPIGTPTSDYYGGHRLGDGLFGESVVCLNAETGKRVWHFQAVHHGLWDYDFPTAPNLMDITVDGREIKALAQVSKQAFTYVFDRVTGEPIWPIEEREVAPSTVPGERAAKTQPFPTKPPAYDRQGVTEEDLIDFTPELHAEALEIFKNYAPSSLFTPPKLDSEGKPVINMPGDGGGTNWPGAAVDPESGRLFVPSFTRPVIFTLGKPDPNRSNLSYTPVKWAHAVPGPQGLPLVKPPYGRVTAIDMNKGDHAWMQPHGDGPKNHSALKDLKLPPLGNLGIYGPLATKTLLFVAGGGRDLDRGGGWRSISVYDKATGEYLGAIPLPRPVNGNPITYMHQGKQYIAFTAGGGRSNPELIALSLP
ncbi:MAG: pyrroloquinoline quinone-dependent dehydrogenase [Candidatus Hydrogenedentes bacterium]|nr:pyrroloquinoline quinone-dependent dehydrogenase [Candidatus Hydrogenedentota bacterium]